MNKLEGLSPEQLISLYSECIEEDEKLISDECFKRYGVKLKEDNIIIESRNFSIYGDKGVLIWNVVLLFFLLLAVYMIGMELITWI